MRICLINDIETGGGAAIAASRLAEGLARQGHEVIRLVHEPDGGAHAWRTIRLVSTKHRWFRGLVQVSRNPTIVPVNVEAALDTIYHRLVRKQLRSLLSELQPDIINIHNIHAARWSPLIVREAASFAPVVWTLHDTWSFTARCPWLDCERYRSGCNASCPTADNYPRLPRRKISHAWEERRQLFAGLKNLTAVTPSRWLEMLTSQGLWGNHRIEIIPNGIDTSFFHPISKSTARELLKIPEDRPVALMTSANILDKRKGSQLLSEALSMIRTPLTLITLGSGAWPWPLDPHRLIPMGYVNHPLLQSIVYSAADFLINPTLADNFPLILQEAIACGTPCVSTPVGGCPEIVRAGQSGWIAEKVTAESLAETIRRSLSDVSSWEQLSRSCRTLAENEYTIELMAERYLALFESMR